MPQQSLFTLFILSQQALIRKGKQSLRQKAFEFTENNDFRLEIKVVLIGLKPESH